MTTLSKQRWHPSEKVILINLFLREFVYTFTLIYMSAIFLIKIGQSSWPRLNLFVQLFMLIFIFSTVFLKGKNFYNIHKFLILFFSILMMSYFFVQDSMILIAGLTVSALVFDLIGEISSSNAIMKILNPLEFKKINPKTMRCSQMANIAATGSVIAIQKWANVEVFCFIVLISTGLNFLSYRKLTALALKEIKKHKRPSIEISSMETLKETTRFAFSNPLVVMALILMILGQIVRFYCDWIYVGQASVIFTNTQNLVTTHPDYRILGIYAALHIGQTYYPR